MPPPYSLSSSVPRVLVVQECEEVRQENGRLVRLACSGALGEGTIVHEYGSTTYGLAMPGSDLDFVVVVDKQALDRHIVDADADAAIAHGHADPGEAGGHAHVSNGRSGSGYALSRTQQIASLEQVIHEKITKNIPPESIYLFF